MIGDQWEQTRRVARKLAGGASHRARNSLDANIANDSKQAEAKQATGGETGWETSENRD